jgi:type I restriction enzyme S subunit
MFGDPVKNEKGWNASKLNDEINILGGYAFKSVDFVVEGIPLIKIGTVNKGYFDKSDLSYLPFNYLKEYERYLIEKGDLLISLTGTIGKDDYGNICICDDSEKYLLNQRVAKLIPKKSINPYYLMYLFKNKDVKNKLTKLSRGIRQANISNRDILNLTVPMPPISLQNQFAEIVKKTESIKITQSESTSDINNLFDALMQKAFNGELVE